jgi:hypothetical protein
MEYIRTAEREFPAGEDFQLEYEGRSGNLVVQGADVDRARVQIVAHLFEESAEDADATLERILQGVRLDGSTLRISPPRVVTGGIFFFNRGPRIDYAVTVPRRSRCKLASSSGRIEVARVHGPVDVAQKSGRTNVRAIGGDVRVLSKSGAIDAEEIAGSLMAQAQSGKVGVDRVKGNVSLQAHSGSVKVEHVGGTLNARAHSGRVDALDIGGDAFVATHSGRVSVTAPRGAVKMHSISGSARYQGQVNGDVEIATTSGSIHFDVDPIKPFFMDAETVSGSIRSDLEPRRGEGPPPADAPRVRLRTVSGAIRIGRKHGITIGIGFGKNLNIDLDQDFDFDMEFDTGDIEAGVHRTVEEHIARVQERAQRHAERAQRQAERAQRRAERMAERMRRRATGETVGEDDEDDEDDDLL